jgi:hypothetical protein
VQFSDGFGGKCNLISASADRFLCYDGAVIRRYVVQASDVKLTLEATLALSGTVKEKCANDCYMGTFAWDGAYYYFTSLNGPSNQFYQVWDAAGSYVGEYAMGNGGGMSGAYFDWSAGRYAVHDGWGGHGGGQQYKCSNCSFSDDSQAYGPVSPWHSL